MTARLVAAASLLVALAGGPAHAAAPQPPVGRWLTKGGSAVIELASCGGALCGRIVGIRTDRPGELLPVDWQGEPQCGLTIVQASRHEGDAWFGRITDPRNGNIWKARLAPAPDGTLHLRGYVGIPLLGQTQVWTRYDGAVSQDCQILDTQQAMHARSLPSPG
jgi:uncharacterized protein (DUF2147 family)